MEEQKSSEQNIQLAPEEAVEKLPPNERRYVETEAQILEISETIVSKLGSEDFKKYVDLQVMLSKTNAEHLIGKSIDQFSKEDEKKEDELRKLGTDLAVLRVTEKVQKGIYSIDDLGKGMKKEVEALIGERSFNDSGAELMTEAPIESFVKPNERQQNKIIKILETGDYNLLNESEVQVNPQERTEVLKKIGNGEITVYQFEDILEEIGAPFQDTRGNFIGIPKGIKEKIDGDEYLSDICHTIGDAIINEGLGGHALRELSTRDQVDRIVTVFTNPDRLWQFSADRVKTKEQSMKVFELMSLLYGKREEYRRQMILLQEEAKK